jgi:hypothetical protein
MGRKEKEEYFLFLFYLALQRPSLMAEIVVSDYLFKS